MRQKKYKVVYKKVVSVKYPRISREDDLRIKLSDKQISSIRSLRKKGKTLEYLAKKFHVSVALIHYRTKPASYRAMCDKVRKKYGYDRAKRLISQRRHYQRKKNNPEFKKYMHMNSRKWIIKNRAKWNKYCRTKNKISRKKHENKN